MFGTYEILITKRKITH